jgi:hypothetical protein
MRPKQVLKVSLLLAMLQITFIVRLLLQQALGVWQLWMLRGF